MRPALAFAAALCALAAGCRSDCTSAADCDRGQRCGGEGFCLALPGAAPISLTPGQAFEAIAVFPAPDDRRAPAAGPVMALTTRLLDMGSLSAASFSVQDVLRHDVPGRFDLLLDPPGAVFVPAAPFARGGSYSVRLTAALKDVQGSPLRSEVAWSFAVAP